MSAGTWFLRQRVLVPYQSGESFLWAEMRKGGDQKAPNSIKRTGFSLITRP